MTRCERCGGSVLAWGGAPACVNCGHEPGAPDAGETMVWRPCLVDGTLIAVAPAGGLNGRAPVVCSDTCRKRLQRQRDGARLGARRVLRASFRDAQIREQADAGAPVDAIAARFGVSKRTVYRAVSSR